MITNKHASNTCTELITNPDGTKSWCNQPLDDEARMYHLMGCEVQCRTHIEQQGKKTLDEIIDQRVRFAGVVACGKLICDVCGRSGARPVPGEGQNLCNDHNYRIGINRWS